MASLLSLKPIEEIGAAWSQLLALCKKDGGPGGIRPIASVILLDD